MPKYLSQEWLDEGRALAASQPERPGASAKMQYVVTGEPVGDIAWVGPLGFYAKAGARVSRVFRNARLTL